MAETATVETLAQDIAQQMHAAPTEDPQGTLKQFDFDDDFQAKVAALALRDAVFNERTEGLVRPEFFENAAYATLVNMGLEYYRKYRRQPDLVTLKDIVKEAIGSKIIRKDMVDDIKGALIKLLKHDIGDRDYAVEKVADFAKHQAMELAILSSADLLQKGKFGEIEKAVKQALEVGAINDSGEYDYFAEIESRTEERLQIAAGLIKPNGVSTGIEVMDQKLYHKGWGKGELSILMGGAKSGKTTALLNFSRNAALLGYNVIYVTLEVSKKIAAERMDAGFANVQMKGLQDSVHDVRERIKDIGMRAGMLKIHEFPSGTMKPSALRRLLGRYKSKGIKIDLLVVDYLDIMAPEYRTNDPIENSKSIWVDVRAIAQEEQLAVLSATQTNRDGFKSSVAKAEHVAEDFNKIRTADIVISINATEEERNRGEARLYWAASRNQEGGFSVFIKQDLAKMQFATKVFKIE